MSRTCEEFELDLDAEIDWAALEAQLWQEAARERAAWEGPGREPFPPADADEAPF